MPTSEKSPSSTGKKKPISMHENVPVWYDCCSCEAEPYWQSIATETEDNQQPTSGKTEKPEKSG